MARDANAIWCAMPCCIKASLYLPETALSRLGTTQPDTTFYAAPCVTSTARNSCVRSDSRITNRPTMLAVASSDTGSTVVIGNNSKIQRERAKS